MQHGKLIVVGAVALIAAVIGFGLVTSSNKKTTVQTAEEEFFPGLRDKLGEVASITISDHEDSINLVKLDVGWGWADRGGYPTRDNTVEDALIDLASMRSFEKMTAIPSKYHYLGVQDISEEGAPGREVRLRDAAGNEMAAFIYGNGRALQGAVAGQGTFVRRVGQEQSWLVKGSSRIHADATQYYDNFITRLESHRFKSFDLSNPAGDSYAFKKDTWKDEQYRLETVPEGRRLKEFPGFTSMVSVFNYFGYDDVKEVADIEFGDTERTVIKAETFGGIRIELTLRTVDDEVWATFQTEFDEAACTALQETIAEDEAAPNKPKACEDVRKDYEAVRRRTERWAFLLPSRIVQSLTRSLDEHIEDIPVEGPQIPLLPPDEMPEMPPADDHSGHSHGEPSAAPIDAQATELSGDAGTPAAPLETTYQ